MYNDVVVVAVVAGSLSSSSRPGSVRIAWVRECVNVSECVCVRDEALSKHAWKVVSMHLEGEWDGKGRDYC
jgi:hypothetical protein